MKKTIKKILALLLVSALMFNSLSSLGPAVAKAADVDNTLLNVKVVKADGTPVSNVELYMESLDYPSYGSFKMGPTNADGKVSHQLEWEMDGDFELKPAADSGFTCETPIDVELGMDSSSYKAYVESVNGEAYTGEITLTVSGEAVVKPVINSVTPAKTSVSKEGETLTLTVKGENLPDTLYYTRHYNIVDEYGPFTSNVEYTGVEVAATGTATEKTIEVPIPAASGTYAQALSWKVKVGVTSETKVATADIPIDGVEAPKTPEIKEVLTKDTVNPNGETVTVTVKGENLPETAYYKVFYTCDEFPTDSAVNYQAKSIALTGTDTEKTCEIAIPATADFVEKVTGWKVGLCTTQYGTFVKSAAIAIGEATEPGTPEGPAEPEVPAVDNTVLNVKVEDKDGNAVPGVALYMDGNADYDAPDVNLGETDAEGKISYTLKSEFDVYYLKPAADSGYTCASPAEIKIDYDYATFKQVIKSVNGGAYTGEVVLVVEKAGSETPEVPEEPEVPETPEFDAKVLNVKTVDKDGKPVAGVQLVLESDSYYGKATLDATNSEGKTSYALKYEVDTYILKPVANTGFTCAEPAEIFVGEDDDWNPIVETVNDEPYTGEVVLVVESDTVVADPVITSVAFADASVSKDGATVAVTVKGENLPDKLYYSRQYMGDDGLGGTMATTVDWTGVEAEATGTAAEKTINVPLDSVEAYPKAIAWKVKVGLSSNTYDGTYKTSGELAIDGVELPKNPEITAVTTSKEAINVAGETITVTVTGENLPETTYYKLFYTCEEFTGDMSYEYMGKQIALTGTDTEKTFEVEIPAASESMDTVTGWKVGVGLTQYGTYVKSPLMGLTAADGVQINETTFPDEEFRRYVSENFDTNADGSLQEEEIQAVTSIDFDYGTYWVADLTGIEYFVNLESLNCAFVALTTIDLSANVNLTYLDCSYNEELVSLDVTKNVNLQELHCYETPLAALDVTNNTELVRLDCNNTQISTIDVTNCAKLFALNVENTNLTTIDISKNPELYEAYISFTGIEKFDISKNPKMGQIRFEETKVKYMDFSNNPELVAVRCANTPIPELDFSKNPKLYELYCFGTNIYSLDLSSAAGLHTLECHNTNLQVLDVTKNPELVGLTCGNTDIKKLDVTKNPALKRLECNDTQIKNLDLSNHKELTLLNVTNTAIAEMKNFDASNLTALEELYCNNAGIETLNLSGNAALYSLDCGNNELTSLDLSGVGYLWYLNTVSPQKEVVKGEVVNGKLVLDMNSVAADLSKVVIPESEDYTYDAATGLVTFNTAKASQLAYTYDHGYTHDELAPMQVTLTAVATPKAVTGAKAALSDAHNTVKFTWNKAADADGYLVSYKKATATTWSNAVATTKLSYVKKDLTGNVKYNFKVVPYKLYKGEKIYSDAQKKVVTITTKKNVKAPTRVKLTLSGGYDDVKISWTKVTGAAGYYVSMKKAGAKTFTRIATTSNLSFVKKNLADGVKYTFQVVPYYKNGTTKVRGFYSKTNTISTLKKLAAPKVNIISYKQVEVKWTNIEGETGYQISRSTKKTGTNIVATYATTKEHVKFVAAKRGTKYYYKVRAYKTVDGKKIFAPWSNVTAYTIK